MMNNDQGPKATTTPSSANTPFKPPSFDHAAYRHMLDGHDLSDAQKDENLDALWRLVLTFVDLKMPPLVQESCGQQGDERVSVPDAARAMVYSPQSQTRKDFSAAANMSAPPRALSTDKKEAS